ncbi:MAG: type III pantothenate kinase [Alphaproteobacteria bacterium]|jgi:type III pantothenate kinase|nr:type III pantothenate kinase [Alphaproteobacteria bacterium]
MLLTIDAGNTNVVFAVYDGHEQCGKWRIATSGRRTSDEYAVWLFQLMALQGRNPQEVSDAIIASVVPAATVNLVRLCRDHFGCEPMVVGSKTVDLDIRVRLDNPDEIGADRLVNAIEGRETYGAPLIVIDFGTATTFDVVNESGDYCGGAIAPGIYLSIEALHNAAALLPKIDVVKPERVIGRSTAGAMQSGLFYGYIAMIEGMVARIKQEHGGEMKVIATGGLAALFSEATDVIDGIDPEMTIRGLVRIFEHNGMK